MSKSIFKVAYTEAVENALAAAAGEWSIKRTDACTPLLASGMFSGSKRYIAHGIIADSERNAKAHALEMWQEAAASNATLMVIGAPK